MMQLEIISREPTSGLRPAPLLFVHGAWHGAWCWEEHFLPYLADHGYSSHALSLRGHAGSPGHERLRWTSIRDYVADVAEVAARLPAPPVIIGHSMGGLVVQKYLESNPAPAAILMASVPPHGAYQAAIRFATRHPLNFLRVNLTLSVYPLIENVKLAHQALFSPQVPEALVARYFPLLQDEAYRSFLDMILLVRSHPAKITCPVLVLDGAQDAVFSPAENEGMARAFGTHAVIYPNMGHDLMLEPGWQQVADRIVKWLEDKGH